MISMIFILYCTAIAIRAALWEKDDLHHFFDLYIHSWYSLLPVQHTATWARESEGGATVERHACSGRGRPAVDVAVGGGCGRGYP